MKPTPEGRIGEGTFLRIIDEAGKSNRMPPRRIMAGAGWFAILLFALLSQGSTAASLEGPMSNHGIKIGITSLALAQMQTTLASSSYETAVMGSQPTSYWRFEETTGATMTNTVPAGSSGTTAGSLLIGEPSASAALGRCIRFSAGNVSIPHSRAIEPTEEFSVEMWMRAGPTASGFALSMGRDVDVGSLKFVMRPTFPDCTLICGVHDYVYGSWTVPSGAAVTAWHHYVFAWSRSSNFARMYVDGTKTSDFPFATTFATNQQPLFIGQHNYPGWPFFFDGWIDEVAIYQRAISESEIAAHYCASGVSSATCCPGDLNGDGKVDGADISAVLSFWGPNPVFPAADINHDGIVNGVDLGEILTNWGPCSH
jgi:Concanavalin A-like lectin/glucanases superfamily